MPNISTDARVLLVSCFMSPKNSLFFGLISSRPTKQAQDAIDELVKVGILNRREQPGGGFKLTLGLDGIEMDRSPPGENGSEKMAFITDNTFAITEPIPDALTAPGVALKAAGVTAEQCKAAGRDRFKKRKND